MVKTPKLVYVLILILFIFLDIIKSNRVVVTIGGNCIRDKDCLKFYGANIRCRKGKCVAI
ncbi:putative Late nodulin [Medicago truncatula]|uniref:Putative Late nodulin n=1 Tax=Medicago truncatula TaxID=3880 RepID=A0A396I282_MEDTR|nr:putative Late nodulin [Medicago truncatula]